MSDLISIDGKEYSTSSLSDSAKGLVVSLKAVDTTIKEKTNLVAVLTKAKRAYIAELKSEMLANKAGFDFSE